MKRKASEFNFTEKLLSGDEELLDNLGTMLLDKDINEEEATILQEECRQHLTKDPENQYAIYVVALICYMRNEYREAIELYELAILKGNALALNDRALMHKDGQGCPVNYNEAIRLFQLAISKGNCLAMCNRAWMHLNGYGDAIDNAEAIRLLDMAIAKGLREAMSARAFMHLQGYGGETNYAEAFRLLDMAIAKGSSYAMCERALLHQDSLVGAVDYCLAAKLYRQALIAAPEYQRPLSELSRLLAKIAPEDRDSLNETTYHIGLALNNDFWQRDPAKFLFFIARDSLLTDKQRFALYERLLPTPPVTEDQPSLDLIGRYYFSDLTQIFSADWKHTEASKHRADLLSNALFSLTEIPRKAAIRGEACGIFATNMFAQVVAETESDLFGLEQAQPYFQEASELGDEYSQQQYVILLESCLAAEQDITEKDIMHRIKVLEEAYSRDIKHVLITLPAILKQTWRKIESNSPYVLSGVSDAGTVAGKQIRDLIRELETHLDQEPVLRESRLLEVAETQSLATAYLKVLKDYKERIPSGIYYQEFISVIEKKEQQIAAVLKLLPEVADNSALPVGSIELRSL